MEDFPFVFVQLLLSQTRNAMKFSSVESNYRENGKKERTVSLSDYYLKILIPTGSYVNILVSGSCFRKKMRTKVLLLAPTFDLLA